MSLRQSTGARLRPTWPRGALWPGLGKGVHARELWGLGATARLLGRWRARLRLLRIGLVATVAAFLMVLWIYGWFASGGTWHRDDGGDYYDLLADAFLAHQVYLKVTPMPELLALPDPYDPDQNAPYRAGDLSLFHGRYYLYFGPVPGVIHAAWKAWTGLTVRVSVIDWILGVGGCLWFWLLLRALRERLFPRLGNGWVLAGFLCFALGGVNPFLQARPIVHWEAVLSASFFTLAGLYWWVRGLSSGPWAVAQLALAGLLLGCAFGSRMTVAGYALGAGLVLVWRVLRPPGGRRWRAIGSLAAFGSTSGALLALLLAYNYARFGSILDFGVNYVLVGIKGLNLTTTTFGVLNANTLAANLSAYFFSRPKLFPFFPFQGITPVGAVGTTGWGLEPPFTPTLFLAPLLLFAPCAALLLLPRWRSVLLGRHVVVGLAIGVAWTLALVLVNTFATGRYMQDFLPGATLLAVLGLWALRERLGSSNLPGRALAAAAAGLVVISAGMGLSYGALELTVGAPRAYVWLGYVVDHALAGAFERVAPGRWTSIYVDSAPTPPPMGLFYPEGAVLRLPSPPVQVLHSIELESVESHPTLVVLELEGQVVANQVLRPGVTTVNFSNGVVVPPTGQVQARLRLPLEPPQPYGHLWPIRVGDLSDKLAPAPTSAASSPSPSDASQLEQAQAESRFLRNDAEQMRAIAEGTAGQLATSEQTANELRQQVQSLQRQVEQLKQAVRVRDDQLQAAHGRAP